MQMNIMELIKNGKIGNSLKSRGGQRHSWNKYIFVKAKKNIVHVYEGSTYKTIQSRIESNDVNPKVCILTPDKVIFNLDRWNHDDNRNWRKQTFNTGPISGFLSLNFLYGCYARHSYNQSLIETNNKGSVIPFAKMEFDWSGNLLSEMPVYAQKQYNEWDRYKKDLINKSSRARYAQKKAEREFRKYEKEGKLDEYPVEDVFKILNAQLRSHAINAIGIEKVLKPYDTKIVDTEIIEGQGKYELIDIQLPSMSVIRWGQKAESQPKWCLYLKMINQSTGEYHLEGVPRKGDSFNSYIPEETVRGALAWRDGEAPEVIWNGNSRVLEKKEWKYIKPIILT